MYIVYQQTKVLFTINFSLKHLGSLVPNLESSCRFTHNSVQCVYYNYYFYFVSGGAD